MRALTYLLSVAPLIGACSIGSRNTYPATSPVRPLADLPTALEVVDSTARAPGPGRVGCQSPLRDPRDDTRLILRSSQGGEVGDYEVPAGQYGVGAQEYLRVDCRTRQPLGAVPRPG